MSQLSLVLHGTGLVCVYSLYGVMQEKIVKTGYGVNAERFNASSLLILCNRLFAMSLAVAIITYKRKGKGSIIQALRPSAPLSYYAVVAILNFLASTCQYEALGHLSFTTTSLAKCVKMIPILLVQRILYRQQTRPRDWIAAGTIALGCFTYLSTLRVAPLYDDESFQHASLGTIFVFGYLLFDSLTSTTQEKYFGRTASSTSPFGPDSNVLPQMIYVNLFSSLFSIVGVLATFTDGNIPRSVFLLLSDRNLQIDVLFLSATAAIGLILLLNSIASFGAFTTSLLMTVRQFLGILLNAGVFSHFGSVGLEGWCGVGWVASGVYIRMDRSWEKDSAAISVQEDIKGSAKEAGTYARRTPSPELLPAYPGRPLSPTSRDETPSARRYTLQYLLPICFPLLLSAIAYIISPSSFDLPPEPFEPSVLIEGGAWEHELHSALLPECEHRNSSTTVRWEGKRRTALASFPRSGNSLTRELVERATNFQTSTVSYCDQFLRESFAGECDHKANLLVKTHYPWKQADNDPLYRRDQYFDQAVQLIRNPLDALYSDWHLAKSPKTADGQLDHAGRVKIGLLGETPDQRAHVLWRVGIWVHHEQYWRNIDIPVYPLRYEDLTHSRLTTVLSLLTFLLPEEDDRPSLSSMSCMTELDESRAAYKSRKAATFASWDKWHPKLRREVLNIAKVGWCRRGYDSMFEELRPDLASGIVC